MKKNEKIIAAVVLLFVLLCAGWLICCISLRIETFPNPTAKNSENLNISNDPCLVDNDCGQACDDCANKKLNETRDVACNTNGGKQPVWANGETCKCIDGICKKVTFNDIDAQAALEKIRDDSGVDYLKNEPVGGNNGMMRWTIGRDSDVYEVGFWAKGLDFTAVKPEVLAKVLKSLLDMGFAIDPVDTYHRADTNVGNKDGYRRGGTVCDLVSGLTTADFIGEPEPGLIDIMVGCGDLTGNEGIGLPIDPEKTKIKNLPYLAVSVKEITDSWSKYNYISVTGKISAIKFNNLQASILISDNEGNYALALISDAPAMENNKEILSNLKKGDSVAVSGVAEITEPPYWDFEKSFNDASKLPSQIGAISVIGKIVSAGPFDFSKLKTNDCPPIGQASPDFCRYGILSPKLENNCVAGFVCAKTDAFSNCSLACKAKSYKFGTCGKFLKPAPEEIIGKADCLQYTYTFSSAADGLNCWCHNESDDQ